MLTCRPFDRPRSGTSPSTASTATDISKLDIQYPTPAYFTVGTVGPGTGTIQNSWTLTLTRTGASAGYGAYTVTFTDQGYDAANSGIQAIPDINPISNSIITTTGS